MLFNCINQGRQTSCQAAGLPGQAAYHPPAHMAYAQPVALTNNLCLCSLPTICLGRVTFASFVFNVEQVNAIKFNVLAKKQNKQNKQSNNCVTKDNDCGGSL